MQAQKSMSLDIPTRKNNKELVSNPFDDVASEDKSIDNSSSQLLPED